MEFNLSLSFGKKKDTRNAKFLPGPAGTTARRSVPEDGLGSLGFLSNGMPDEGLRAPRGRDISRRDPDLAYSLHLWTRVAINKMAKAVAAYPIVIEPVDRKQAGRYEKQLKTMRKALYNPNVMDGYQDFISGLTADLALVGAAAAEVTHWKLTGEPAELYAVPVKTIRVNIAGGKINPGKAYTQMVATGPGRTFSVKDMLYFRFLPRAGYFIPETIVANLLRILQQDGYAEKFNLDSLQNGNLVRQLIALGDKENPMDPETVAAVQQEWDEKHKGGLTNRRVTFIPGSMATPIPLDPTREDMQWEQLQKYCVRAVAAAFDIPLIYFSWPDDTKFANAEFEEKRFAVQTVYPLTVAICDKLNQFWVPQFGLDPQEEVRCVPSPKLEAITELDLRREGQDLTQGVLTVNEVRERRGEEPTPWGGRYTYNGREFVRIPTEEDIERDDEEARNPTPPPMPPMVPPGAPTTPPSATPAKPQPGKQPPGQAPQVKPGTEKGMAARMVTRRFMARRTKARKLYRRGIGRIEAGTRAGLLDALQAAVDRMVAAVRRVPQADVDALRRVLEAEPVTLTPADELGGRKGIDWTEDIEAAELDRDVVGVIRAGYTEAYLLGTREASSLLGGVTAGFGVVPQGTLDKLGSEWIRESEKIKFAVDRTAQRIVMDGVRAGQSVRQLADSLQMGIIGGVREDGRIVFHDGTDGRHPYSMTPENWADVTAQTNLTRAANAGRVESWKASGVQTKTWVTMGDERVRDEHAALEGETVPIDEPFSNGEMFPGEAPNCRCELDLADSEVARLSGEGEEI